jgi:hypothetical protein
MTDGAECWRPSKNAIWRRSRAGQPRRPATGATGCCLLGSPWRFALARTLKESAQRNSHWRTWRFVVIAAFRKSHLPEPLGLPKVPIPALNQPPWLVAEAVKKFDEDGAELASVIRESVSLLLLSTLGFQVSVVSYRIDTRPSIQLTFLGIEAGPVFGPTWSVP